MYSFLLPLGVLHSLACGKFKLLKRVDDNVSDKGGIKITDTFSVNEQFR